ncbi:MAG: efflux transporter outer membrane subunit [Pseudomonadota bacterium]
MKPGRLELSIAVALVACAAATTLMLAGCAVGPDHQRPALALPAQYPGATAGSGSELAPQWWTLYRQPELDRLVAQAIERNRDLEQAAARVEQADAVARQAGAALLPRLDLNASAGRARVSPLALPPNGATGNAYQLGLAASFEIDFWGRLRRGREAARAQLLASVHARDTVQLTVAALTAQVWFGLRALDEQVALTRATLATREEGLRLLSLRLKSGTGSQLDVEQGEGLRAASAVLLRELMRQRASLQTQLGVLVGQLDLTLAEAPLQGLPLPPQPPAGLPSALLERRPDVRSAEQQLAAASARIGVARAEQLPAVSLTGGFGAESAELGNLLKTPSRIWSIGLGLAQPLFDGGHLAARTDRAAAAHREAQGAWRGVVEDAFKDVADALSDAQAARESQADLERADRAAANALKLARARYDSGYSGHLDLLDAQRSAAAAQLDLVRNRQAQLSASVALFRALGGGWQPPLSQGAG